VIDLIILHAVIAFLGVLLLYLIGRTIYDAIAWAWRLLASGYQQEGER
jgi:hypothetical protein